MEVQELENKIKELEARLSRLEKIENKRQTFKIIKIVIKIIVLLALLFGLWMGYNYVNETIIKPYKETVDEIKGTYDNVKNYDFSLDNILGKNKDKDKDKDKKKE